MYWSKYFIPTLKETPIGTEAISHQYLLRAGLVQMLTSGVYTYLPLGLRVLSNIERIIREEMNAAGANELLMPCIHPLDIWKQTGRDKTLNDVMIKFKDGKGRDMCLGPTHEEIITDVARNHVRSYRQLPLTLYQIQTKFRDELRPRFGVVRACEFIMKDAYSFDRDKEGLEVNYQKMYEAYKRIFKRLDLDVVIVKADSGAMGGDLSHEFMVPAAIGEDEVEVNGKKQVALELGHIFQLGTKYTVALGANFLDEDGKSKPMIMGCYGIGVSRVIAAIIEVHHDDKGIIWPKEVAPFDVEILPIFKTADDETMKLAMDYYEKLTRIGINVLCDDRDDTAGRKFNDADLIGIPLRLTVGQRNLAENKVELKIRRTNEVILENKDNVISRIQGLLNQTTA